MNQLKFITVIFGCLLLAACGSAESDAKKAVLRELTGSEKASNGVKFGKFTRINKDAACLTFNKSVGAGAKEDDMQAYLSKTGKGWVLMQYIPESHETCIENMKYVSERDHAIKNGTSESDAKKVVLSVLKDPDSAKFGEFTQIKDYACLTVNARNAMGGYTGDQEVYLILHGKKWDILSFGELNHESCIEAMKRVYAK